MNRIYIFEHEKIKNDQYLINDSKRIDHILQILKKTAGEKVKVTLLDKGIGIATILEASKNKIIFEIDHLEKGIKTCKHLLVALCRPPSMKKILEHGTTLGVNSITFFPAFHSEKSYLKSHIFKENNLVNLLALGIAQSGCYYKLPKINLITSLDKFEFNSIDQKFLFSLKSKNSLKSLGSLNDKSILFAIGPERGWVQSEEEQFLKKYNFNAVSLGPSILRTEIATYLALYYSS